MGHLRHLWGFALLTLLLLAGCNPPDLFPSPPPNPNPNPNPNPRTPKMWTVLVYQAGDNDLEDALIKDFNEMERVGSDDNINIVALLDRSPRYDTSNGNWSTTRRYYITRDPEETFPPDFPLALTTPSEVNSLRTWAK
jgi:hypothetical protein